MRTEAKEKKSSKKMVKELSNSEFEKRVVELAKKGVTAEKIGEQLRQQETHSKGYGKKISKILEEKNLYINPDLKNVEEKLKKVREHYEKNKQDKRAKREKDRIYAKLRKLRKYHKIEIQKK